MSEQANADSGEVGRRGTTYLRRIATSAAPSTATQKTLLEPSRNQQIDK
jgi:hypothetical protein